MDDEPLPIKLGPVSNGEFLPVPHDDFLREVIRRTNVLADENARRAGMSRRRFLGSAAGAATMLFVLAACADAKKASQGERSGGTFNVPEETTVSSSAALDTVGGDEFVFDVQTHHVDLQRDWAEQSLLAGALAADVQGGCGEAERLACWSAEHFVREVFVKSDTTVACLTMLPAASPEARPLLDQEAAATRELVDRLADSPRLVIHGMVNPELGAPQLDDMQRMKESSKVAAWKVYTQYGGWRLDDEEVGAPFLERARALGVPLVCVHKGLSFPDVVGDRQYGSPADIGPAARAFPDLSLLVYHSGYEASSTEGPYDPAGAGIDRLIRSLRDAGFAEGEGNNVYAELGSTWRLLMTKPDEAAHALGKLLKQLGPDNVLWGTDTLWYGSPQPQIEAFRAFQIPAELQEQHGYPALTAELKAKILGLNGARVYGVDPEVTRCAIREDALAQRRAEHEARPTPLLGPIGPKTRREFFAHFRRELASRAG
jgi:predicted TIM-barrel fold metal-dependent hydrolase